jgi:hypothetical protein
MMHFKHNSLVDFSFIDEKQSANARKFKRHYDLATIVISFYSYLTAAFAFFVSYSYPHSFERTI